MNKMKHILKPAVFIVLGVSALYNSVYFLPLGEVVEERESRQFNASVYREKFWNELKDQLDSAIHLKQLTDLLSSDAESTFNEHSNVLGIGNIRFFLIQSSGTVKGINDDHIVLEIDPDLSVRLMTDYIFGNAVRDASGLIDVNEFSNTMHFNEVSSQINQRIADEVLPPFLNKVGLNDKVSFVGALELHRIFFDLQDLEVIPVQIQILPVD
jgi:predicted lipoprotein